MAQPVEYGRPAEHVSQLWRAEVTRAAVVVGGAIVLVVAGLAFGGRMLAVGAIAAVAAVAWVNAAVQPKVGRLTAGRNAERLAARALRRSGVTAVLHGYDLDGRGGDADHVVVGPVLAVVETKHGRGKVSVGRDGAVTVGGKRLPRDPLEQARRQAGKLSRRIGRQVSPVVCITETSSRPFQRSGVWVCAAADLPAVLRSLPTVLTHDQALRLAAELHDTRHRPTPGAATAA